MDRQLDDLRAASRACKLDRSGLEEDDWPSDMPASTGWTAEEDPTWGALVAGQEDNDLAYMSSRWRTDDLAE